MGPCIPDRIGIGSVGFGGVGGGKPENPEKNPWSKDENQQQTQPTYDTGPESNPGHIGGRRALSPLRHPCSHTVWKDYSLVFPYSLVRLYPELEVQVNVFHFKISRFAFS